MDRRTALSPKKLRSSNILPSPSHSSPGSPTKKAPRASRASPYVPVSPSKSRQRAHLSPSPGSGKSLDRHCRAISPVKLSPYKIFTGDRVYATDIDSQIAANDQLVLSPPTKPQTSPSPQKRSALSSPVLPRMCLASLQESERVPRVATRDPFNLPSNAFLTPPRPRISAAVQVREEERLCKSASPVLGCRRSLDRHAGFTIYVDSSEYYAVCDATFSRGRDVNKENFWKPVC